MKQNPQQEINHKHPVLRIKPASYDRALLVVTLILMGLGLLMVASSSIVISEKQYGQSFHYLYHQILYLGLGFVLSAAVLRIDMHYWQRNSRYFLLAVFALLIAVLIPGLGHAVNGSMRWLGVGPLRLQVSEIAKLVVIIYLASYAVRYPDQLRNHLQGFLKPLLVLGFISFLLLREPDFGATVVIMLTAFGILFLAGVRLIHFMTLLLLCLMGVSVLAVSAPYRLARMTTFLNPWATQFDSGYQLTQSLIAFGRGGWFGVGIGASIQKLFYLPEAHTDFLFAVLAEEFGLLGVTLVIFCFAVLVARAFTIGRHAEKLEQQFSAYVAYGIALWIGLQATVNIGVNSGLLPTKGLTLPLMSYGGSSMLVVCVALALLFRIDYENRSYFTK